LKQAARLFVGGLAPKDSVSVIFFSHSVRSLPQEPRDHDGLRRALEGVSSGGSTALNDAVFAGLLRADPRLGRPVVLVFSDGVNRVSWLEERQVLEAARALEAVVYAILARRTSAFVFAGPGGEVRFFGLGAEPPRAEMLWDLAEATGGAVLEAEDGHLEQAFRRILDTLNERYILRYEPAGVKGRGWHKLKVRLTSPKGEVTVRQGYLRGGS
jgi:VWFA-related protein